MTGLPALVAVVCVLALAGCSSQVDSASADDTAAAAGPTTFRGIDNGRVREFLGIRYAQAPVGPLRWAPPVPPQPVSGPVAAVTPGASCPQPSSSTDNGPQNEDCLFLNVTTPRDLAPGERLPVFVWWHGGGFATGSGAAYDAQRLATRGRLAVVTVNYRLGALGYLGLPGLPDSGAFGFADQVQSVQWTRDNIAAFGGDPDNVTVAGESAGGGSACALLASPSLAALKVKHVIVMSGSCSAHWPENGLALGLAPRGFYAPTATVAAAGLAAASTLGCNGRDALACLRAQPVEQMLQLGPRFTTIAWGNDLLPVDPSIAVPATPPAVPVLYGGDRDEGRSFFRDAADRKVPALTPGNYQRLLDDAFGADAARVGAEYPLSQYGGSTALAWSTLVTDGSWSCPAERDQRALAARTPTYGFEFSRPDGPIGANGLPRGGAPHGSELDLLFNQPTRTDESLADLTVDYWASFARTGRPSSASGPSWPAVSTEGPTMVLDLSPTGARLADVSQAHRCGFWNSLP